MTEEWRDIEEFCGTYQVSSIGRVRRSPTAPRRTNSVPGRVLVTRPDCNGYHRALLYNSEKKKYRSIGVCTAVLEAFVGVRPDGTEASHKNGICTDNRLENLCWETRKANHARKHVHGTMYCGERQHKAKLRSVDIPAIRSRIGSETHDKIAKDYGVSREAITSISMRKTWTHVT